MNSVDAMQLQDKAAFLSEISAEQRRRLIDAQQIYEAWRQDNRELLHSFRGTKRWKRVGNQEYLYSIYRKAERSLGVRSPETEKILTEYMSKRAALMGRRAGVKQRLMKEAKINRAFGLGRVPTVAASIMRRLDAEGLLGKHLFIVGTQALYAYEAAAGVTIETGLLVTGDVDPSWDTRRRLSLALVDVREQGVIGLLRKVDKSFASLGAHNFRAVNRDGYYVDLIRPTEKNEMLSKIRGLGNDDGDLEAAAIDGLGWLINAPKFERVAMAEDGRPVWLSCVDPRAFALHKLWLAQRSDRDLTKRSRDHAQAIAAATIATDYLGLRFDDPKLSALTAALQAALPSQA